MSEAYEEIAVSALLSWLRANVPSALRAVETAVSAPAHSIPDPQDYRVARLPDWTVSPSIQIYDVPKTTYPPAGWRNRVAMVPVVVAISRIGTTDVEADEIMMRRYVRAIRNTIHQDHTLGTEGSQQFVAAAIVESTSPELAMTDHARTRLVRSIELKVTVSDVSSN